MRLKITIETKDKFIPFEYHGFLQGVIYHSLDEEQGKFFHDEGFGEHRIYKMFVFSELSGHYHVVKGGLMFDETASFYISSVSSKLLNRVYQKVLNIFFANFLAKKLQNLGFLDERKS